MASELETAPFDEALACEESRHFAHKLFDRFPWLRGHAQLERRVGSEHWGLLVIASAPSGDHRADVVVWDDGGDDPTVEFGAWHMHAEHQVLLDLLASIFSDRYVTSEELGREPLAFDALLDLADEDALLDQLTEPDSTGRVRLRSWSGALDREWTIADLERGERPRRA
jgi:hypothetical protein